MQKNETKDEMLIHSLKQVITLQKKFMPGNLDHKIEALMVEVNTDILNKSLQSLIESHDFTERTFHKIEDSFDDEENFKNGEIEELKSQLKCCKEVMAKMQEKLNKMNTSQFDTSL